MTTQTAELDAAIEALALRRSQLAIDAAYLADGFANLEALKAFREDLSQLGVLMVRIHRPSSETLHPWREWRLVDSLIAYLETLDGGQR